MARLQAVPDNPVGRLTTDHPGIVKFGRAGWFAKGVVYLVAGVLALVMAGKAAGWSSAATAPNKEASPTGALKAIAQMSGGALLMWLLAAGMLLYAMWRVASALLPGGSDAMGWITRVGYLVSAVIYTTLAVTAISLARSGRAGSNDNSKVTSISGRLMTHSGGRIVVGAAGVICIAAGVYHLLKGARNDVTEELDLSSLSTQRRRWTERLGAIGEIGRGLGIGLIGFFLVRSAFTYNAAEATGLDGALRRLATDTWGLVVVIVIGIGFAAYGFFCLATFSHRELQAP
jgi:hypothetical protein